VSNRYKPRGRPPRRTLARAGALLLSAVSALVGASAAAAASTAPPPVTVLTSLHGLGDDDVFISPTGDAAQYANGPEIMDRRGHVVWFHAIPTRGSQPASTATAPTCCRGAAGTAAAGRPSKATRLGTAPHPPSRATAHQRPMAEW